VPRDGKRTLTLQFGDFTRTRLEEWRDQQGVALDSLLRQAILYYLADRDSTRRQWRYPRFKSRAPAEGPSVSVGLDEDIVQSIEGEARAQNVPPDRLIEYAALYYLADLSSGRVAARLADAAEREDEAERTGSREGGASKRRR